MSETIYNTIAAKATKKNPTDRFELSFAISELWTADARSRSRSSTTEGRDSMKSGQTWVRKDDPKRAVSEAILSVLEEE